MMISKKLDFSPGSTIRNQIVENYRQPKWLPFRNWFNKFYSKDEKHRLGQEFYKDLELVQEIIEFPVWFINKYSYKYISMIEKDYRLNNGEIIKSVFPPSKDFKINRDHEELHFSAFKKAIKDESIQATMAHVNQIIQQNNCTNLGIRIISEMLQDTNNKIDSLIKEKGEASNTKKEEDLAMSIKSSIQPPPEIKDYKLKPMNDVMEVIKEKLSNIQINTLEEENMDDETFEAYVTDSINRLDKGKGAYSSQYVEKPRQRMYYYPRPTPQDVLNEEQEYVINNSYSGKSIYEWNLDGYTDRQVFMMTHRMMMYATIAKNNQNTDTAVCKIITSGFTGQLKGWWDNYIGQN